MPVFLFIDRRGRRSLISLIRSDHFGFDAIEQRGLKFVILLTELRVPPLKLVIQLAELRELALKPLLIFLHRLKPTP